MNDEKGTKKNVQRTTPHLFKNKLHEKLSAHLFWDVDRSKIKTDEHSKFLIGRVIQYGFFKDWQLLVKIYDIDKIKETLIEIRFLDDISLHFASNLFSIPLEKFRCYTIKQSAQNFWNY